MPGFADGGRFLNVVSNTLWVYALNGTQEDIKILRRSAQVGGLGNYFWSANGGGIVLYKVGAFATAAGSSAIGTDTLLRDTGDHDGCRSGSCLTGGIRIIDLSGNTPVITSYVFPAGHGFRPMPRFQLSSFSWAVPMAS